MKARSPKSIALIEAACLLVYIGFFAFCVFNFGDALNSYAFPQFLHIALFLSAFVFSALLCSTIVFGYPVILVLNGNKKMAIEIVMWCILWLALLGLVSLLCITLFVPIGGSVSVK